MVHGGTKWQNSCEEVFKGGGLQEESFGGFLLMNLKQVTCKRNCFVLEQAKFNEDFTKTLMQALHRQKSCLFVLFENKQSDFIEF